MKSSEHSFCELPIEIAVTIVTSLQVLDIISLSSCSHYWRDVCASNRVWESLFRDKWPGLYENRKHEITKRWKRVYLEELKEMSKQVTPVANYLDSYSFHGSVEIRYYQRAIAMLRSMHFTFEDVQLLMFKPKLNAVLNLVGVHYCIMELGVPANIVMEALRRFKIVERIVCVQWKKLYTGFGLVHTDTNFMNFSLGDIASTQDGALWELQHGYFRGRVRVLISSA